MNTAFCGTLEKVTAIIQKQVDLTNQMILELSHRCEQCGLIHKDQQAELAYLWEPGLYFIWIPGDRPI